MMMINRMGFENHKMIIIIIKIIIKKRVQDSCKKYNRKTLVDIIGSKKN